MGIEVALSIKQLKHHSHYYFALFHYYWFQRVYSVMVVQTTFYQKFQLFLALPLNTKVTLDMCLSNPSIVCFLPEIANMEEMKVTFLRLVLCQLQADPIYISSSLQLFAVICYHILLRFCIHKNVSWPIHLALLVEEFVLGSYIDPPNFSRF